MNNLLMIQVVSTWAMTGIIWFVQRVQYPSFKQVDAGSFRTFQAKGLANKEIGQALDMSPSTVRAHVTAILKTLGVENRTQAATSPMAQVLFGSRG